MLCTNLSRWHWSLVSLVKVKSITQATWLLHMRIAWCSTLEPLALMLLEGTQRSIGTSTVNTEAVWCLAPMHTHHLFLHTQIWSNAHWYMIAGGNGPGKLRIVPLLTSGQIPVQLQDTLAAPPGDTWKCCQEYIECKHQDLVFTAPSHA